MKTVIILGSSRQNGETKKVVSELITGVNWDLIDLKDYDIQHFDYDHQNRDDDYLPLIKNIADYYDLLIFATPVYWYAMSGIMKVFLDRLTDLLRTEKDTGRKFRNKHMAVISSSNGDNLGDDFWLPFKKTADYLGMSYVGDMHTFQDRLDADQIAAFRKTIEEYTKN